MYIGFEEISKCITEYCEKSAHSRAVNTLENYRKKYSAYIETSVVDVSEMKEDSADGIIFPSKREIFVPQSFKTLMYKKDMHLEDKAVWARIDDWENIGKFIGDVLRHSISGSLPLLILGHPGAGKSLLCNMLAAQILCHEYHVIIVKMRDSNAEQTIMQQINEQIERDFSNGCLWSEIAESQLYKPLLIVFDGYHFGVNEESCYVLKIMTKAMEKVSDREKETLPELSNFNGFIEKLIDYIFSSVQKNSKTAKQVIESLKVLDDYMMVQNDKYMTDTNCFMIEEMIFECFRKRRGSFDVDMMLIKSIYILQKYGREDIDDRIPYLLNETIRRLDVERLYYEEPTIFFDLLTIVNSGSSYCVSEQMIRMVMWIVENKWKQLSIMEYRQICKFAEITNNDELRVILQQLVG